MRLNPTNYAKAYLELARNTASAHLPRVSATFWQMVWRRKHFMWRKKIITEINRLWYEQNNQARVDIFTGRLLEPKLLTNVRKALEHGLHKEVEVEVSIKPHLLSGMVIQVGDKRYDASLKGKLDQLYRKLAGE